MATSDGARARLRRYWDRHARSYDRQMSFMERRLLGDHRDWVCSQAEGDVLEVSVGTGLNLAHYPREARVTGLDWSPAMLEQAQRRAEELGRSVRLVEGDAQALEFADESFDTVVCTYSLCGIPDDRQAVAEMRRVLRPGGRVRLVDHVEAEPVALRAVQRLLELVTVPLGGEYLRRRPSKLVEAAGFEVEQRERSRLGIVERVVARKPLER
jgi:ubiquinone/menaquinone biosynthesis C-methylase UbiE